MQPTKRERLFFVFIDFLRKLIFLFKNGIFDFNRLYLDYTV